MTNNVNSFLNTPLNLPPRKKPRLALEKSSTTYLKLTTSPLSLLTQKIPVNIWDRIEGFLNIRETISFFSLINKACNKEFTGNTFLYIEDSGEIKNSPTLEKILKTAQFPKLKKIHLHGSEIFNTSFSEMATSKTIEELEMIECRSISINMLIHLKKMPLKKLLIHNCRSLTSASGMRHIAKIPLKILELNNSRSGIDEAAMELLGTMSLEKLSLKRSYGTGLSRLSLLNFKTLKELNLEGACLENTKELDTLKISYPNLKIFQ